MSNSILPQQLLDDCHHMGRLGACELFLQRNARLHWFIVYPDTDLQDVLDLPAEKLHVLMAECAKVSSFLKQALGYPKVNFAGLGNVFPDMHLHVVGRRDGDACWPQPIWGNLPEGGAYTEEALDKLRAQLQETIGLQAAV